MIIKKKLIGLGPEIGTAQEADKRICLPLINLGPRIGTSVGDDIITEDGYYFETEDGENIILE